MENGHRRKKQPDLVRERILEAAAAASAELDTSIISLGDVARRAGVTKGGLLHHFPNKRILIEALYRRLLAQFDQQLDAVMADDPNPRGRFTRAYVRVTTALTGEDSCRLAGSASLAMSTDQALCDQWKQWLEERLRLHGESLGSPVGRMIRYTADGIWLESFFSKPPETQARAEVIGRLLDLTETI